jgi:DNA-binding CsgD family transcriptional regulator
MATHGMNDKIDRLEQHYFVGRAKEIETFTHFLLDADQPFFILNVCGSGGIGKSYLLRELVRIANQHKRIVLMPDTQVLKQNPNQFVQSLMRGLNSTERSGLDALNEIAEKQGLVLIIDEYHHIGGLNAWLRDYFLCGLSSKARIIISGRTPLDGPWAASPAWRQSIITMPLDCFSKPEVTDYLSKHGIVGEEAIRESLTVSAGHPLMLSLIVPMLQHRSVDASLPIAKLMPELVSQWLNETTDESLKALIKLMSIPRMFTQEMLEIMSGNTITDEEFISLTRLSFVKPTASGWIMQDQIREAVRSYFKKNKPKIYQDSLARCVNYWYSLIQKNSGAAHQNPNHVAVDEFIYCLSDSMVRSVLKYTGFDSTNRLETMDSHNFEEVVRYLERRKKYAKLKRAQYVDIESVQTYKLELTPDQDEKRAELVRPQDWLVMGLDSVKLLKNASGQMIGIVVMIPINRSTLPYLQEEPVSSTYFQALSAPERTRLAVSEQDQSGWYVRMIDVEDADDSAARAELMNYCAGYIRYGSHLITATSLPFYRSLLLGLGFVQSNASAHYEYGDKHPSYHYVQDLRTDVVDLFLQRMAEEAGLPLTFRDFQLTDRETEIARYIMQGWTNNEIAKKLFLSEITVKKHVSNILQKAGVKNRFQIIKLLMEQPFF